jgi:hypothetical protein
VKVVDASVVLRWFVEAEVLQLPWLTADRKILRRLRDDARIRAL